MYIMFTKRLLREFNHMFDLLRYRPMEHTLQATKPHVYTRMESLAHRSLNNSLPTTIDLLFFERGCEKIP